MKRYRCEKEKASNPPQLDFPGNFYCQDCAWGFSSGLMQSCQNITVEGCHSANNAETLMGNPVRSLHTVHTQSPLAQLEVMISGNI